MSLRVRPRSRTLAACALAAVGAMVLPSALADESSRRRLRDEIDRLLSDIASELRDVPGDSGTSDLERTIDYAGRVSDRPATSRTRPRTTPTPAASASRTPTSPAATAIMPATCAS